MAILDNNAPGSAQPEQAQRRQRNVPLHDDYDEPQWRSEFPYRWREDDVVTRRDTLRFLVGGAGALFVATAALDAIGHIADVTSARPDHIVAVAKTGELAVNESKVFTFPDQFGQGILINLPDKGLIAYSDVCTHLSCAVLYQGDGKHLFCPCHEGLFDVATGNVLAGPPTRPLPIIELSVQGDTIYAVREVAR